jgi:hypothetical protein
VYENLIFPLVILLFIIFILVVPSVLYAGFRKIRDPVPSWLPLLSVGIVLLVLAGLIQLNVISHGNSMIGTLLIFSLMLLLTTLAVISSYLLFGKKAGIDRPWATFSLLSFISVFLLFWSTMGESREGGPLPMFFLLLPLTGWIIDGAAAVLHIQDIVYSPALPVHTLLQVLGLYLEVFIIAGLFYALMSLSPKPDNE